MRLINEEYEFLKSGIYKTSKGKERKTVYVDPGEFRDVKKYKDTFKKYNAFYINGVNTYGWFVDKNTNVYNELIEPCIKDIMVEEATGMSVDDILAEIERIQNELSTNKQEYIDTGVNVKEIENKIASFKEELISKVGTEEFFKEIENVLNLMKKLSMRRGEKMFSFMNTLLIILQQPDADYVASRSDWRDIFNREPKQGEHPIFLLVPQGRRLYHKGDKEKVIKDMMDAEGVSSEDELSPGARRIIKHKLSAVNAYSFKYSGSFYDISQTQVIDNGKGDLFPNEEDEEEVKKNNKWWYDVENAESDETTTLIDALSSYISSTGITISSTSSLGGARGVSSNGEITLLDTGKRGIATLSTLIHEFAHEMLHQRYLKNSNNELGRFHLETTQGRKAKEQQAELTAWIVLRFFGYEPESHLIYTGIWGMNKENAPKVFDTVASVANQIIYGIIGEINKKVEELNESNIHISSRLQNIIKGFKGFTGEEIADIVGPQAERDYREGEKMKQEIETIKESFYRIYNKLI